METSQKPVWDPEDLEEAAAILRRGGVILYPTDTIWGIGCDATNTEAVEKVFRIKERPVGKSMLILVRDIAMAGQFTRDTPEVIWQVMKETVDPLTVIFPHAINLAPNLPAADNSIGMRIPKDDFCQALLSAFGKPLVSSSANRSNSLPPRFFSDIPVSFLKYSDYVVRWRRDDERPSKPSTVIKINDEGEMEMIRP